MGYTAIISTGIKDISGSPLNGTVTFQGPVNSLGQPISVTANGGPLLFSRRTFLVVNGAITTDALGGTAQVADTTIGNPTNWGYKLEFFDTKRGQIPTPGYLCVQPAGSTWSLDTYVTPQQPLPIIVTGPAGLNFRGAWAANTVYAPLDVFSYNFALYQATSGFTSGSSFSTANTVLFLQGTPGLPGAASGSTRVYFASQISGVVLDCNLDTGLKLNGSGQVATDNTTALNTFLQTGSPTNPIRLIMDGGSLVTGIVTAPAGVEIEGLGFSTGFYQKDGSGASLSVITNGAYPTSTPVPALQNGWAIRNLRINGNRKYFSGSDGTNHYTQGVVVSNVRGFRMENVWLYDICTYAVMLTNCTDIVFSRCRTDSPSNAGNTDGFHLNGYCYDTRIDGCRFNNGDDSIALNSVEAVAGPIDGVTVTNCVFDNCCTALRAYYFSPGPPVTQGSVKNVTFDNCVITLTKDAANYINCAFLLGLNTNDSRKNLDGIRDFRASNCTVSSSCPVLIFGDSCGSVELDNVTWFASGGNDTPFATFIGLCSVSYFEMNNCHVYRNSSTGYPYLLSSAQNGAFAGNIGIGAPGGGPSNIQKMRVNGWDLVDMYGQTYTKASYLIDMTYITIAQLVIDRLSSDRVAAFANPYAGYSGLGAISGSGLLESGFRLPASLIMDNCPYLNASGNAAVNLSGAIAALASATGASPVAKWVLGEGSGLTFNDSVGTATLTSPTSGDVTWGASTGFPGSVPTFTSTAGPYGTSNATKFGSSVPFSVSVWFKVPSSIPSYSGLVGQIDGSGNGWCLRFGGSGGSDANTMQLLLTSSGTSNWIYLNSGGLNLTAGSVYHILMTFDGSAKAAGVNFFLNGASIGVSLVRSDNVAAGFASSATTFRTNGGDYGSPFAGLVMADIRIFASQLTVSGAKSLYAAGPA